MLTPHQFDQDKLWWWRVVAEQWTKEYVMSDRIITATILEAIRIMKYYVDHYEFAEEDYYMHQLIRFHIAQCYAEIGEYDHAIWYLNQLTLEWYDKVWHEYLEFTIKFLEWNLDECQTIHDSLPNDWSIINTETIHRMCEFISHSYLEAYYGIELAGIKQSLQDQNI